MAQVPSTRWDVARVMSMVRELTKTTDQRKVLVDQGRFFYDAALSEVITLLNAQADPAYFVTTPIIPTTGAVYYRDNEQAYPPADTAISSTLTYSNGVYTFTPASSIPPVGSILTVVTYNSDEATMTRGCLIVTSVGATAASCTLLWGVVPITASNLFHSFVCFDGSLSEVDFSTFTVPVDRILCIYDSLVGQCKEIALNEFRSLQNTTMVHSSYSRDIVWTQVGNKIQFKAGANVVQGAKFLDYQRQPSYPVNYNDSDRADIADKWIPLLVKRIYVYVILQLENDIPTNLDNEINSFFNQAIITADSEAKNAVKRRSQMEQK